jgi:hypothetical protein
MFLSSFTSARAKRNAQAIIHQIPAYSNHPEVNSETVRVAGVIPECARVFAGIGVEEVGHMFFPTVF